ncbi:AP2-like ethylene-responsive transcription factor ANT [Silene latifolia]|uniref:AP2-like ethylene-responsive transcription factor ANT n=1 Tax=Silene latifolia TaxID=37657 RepID=UPI003D777D4C
MKSLSENHENNEDFQNWLGFSLSPNMKMENNSNNNNNNNITSSSPSCTINTDLHFNHYHNHETDNMYLSAQEQHQHHLNSAPLCFDNVGVEENNNNNITNINNNIKYNDNNNNNGGFMNTPLTVMPLKSDGSLCIMEALTRSQQTQVPSVPKLENFFGGGQERETMALSLDSIYYQQTQDSETHHQQQQQQQQQFDSYFSGISCHGYSEEGLFKNWINNVDNINHNGLLIHNVNVNANGGNNSSNVSVAAVQPVSCGELQSLSLSMSPGSQSSCVTANAASDSAVIYSNAVEITKKRAFGKVCHKQTVHRKSIETFGQRTSQYRGVTKHRWTGRYEAHLWDNSCKKEGQTRKGRQVYLGGYDMEEKAARAYDLAALKYWGLQTHTNCPIENYKDEIEEMKNMTRQEYVAHLRRKSSGFSRGASIYRGVTRHHQHGRWQARIGRVAGNKDLYLGTFSTQEEAAEAYDVAAIKFRGLSAVTNFDISRYDVEKIMSSNALLAGDQAKRAKVELIKPNYETPPAQIAGDSSHWKMMPYHDSQGEQQSNSCINNGHYANPSFALALQDIVGHEAHDSAKSHFSNTSSLVTSLNSSREGSPGANEASRFMGVGSVVSPWAQSAIPMDNHPLFVGWGDV